MKALLITQDHQKVALVSVSGEERLELLFYKQKVYFLVPTEILRLTWFYHENICELIYICGSSVYEIKPTEVLEEYSKDDKPKHGFSMSASPLPPPDYVNINGEKFLKVACTVCKGEGKIEVPMKALDFKTQEYMDCEVCEGAGYTLSRPKE